MTTAFGSHMIESGDEIERVTVVTEAMAMTEIVLPRGTIARYQANEYAPTEWIQLRGLFADEHVMIAATIEFRHGNVSAIERVEAVL